MTPLDDTGILHKTAGTISVQLKQFTQHDCFCQLAKLMNNDHKQHCYHNFVENKKNRADNYHY